jgi:hypothetical protein
VSYAEALIDKATTVCGSQAALARKLSLSPALVTLMRKGERALTPEVAAMLADLVGEDAREAVIASVIEGARGTPRETAMREILGKALAAGAAAMSAFSYNGDSIGSTGRAIHAAIERAELTRLYIVSIRKQLRRLLPRGRRRSRSTVGSALMARGAARSVRSGRHAISALHA